MASPDTTLLFDDQWINFKQTYTNCISKHVHINVYELGRELPA